MKTKEDSSGPYMTEEEKGRWEDAMVYWRIKLQIMEEALEKDDVNPQEIEWQAKQLLCSVFTQLKYDPSDFSE